MFVNCVSVVFCKSNTMDGSPSDDEVYLPSIDSHKTIYGR